MEVLQSFLLLCNVRYQQCEPYQLPVLASQARDELVDYVCKKEMGVYSQIFAPVGDTAQLDRVGEHSQHTLPDLPSALCSTGVKGELTAAIL